MNEDAEYLACPDCDCQDFNVLDDGRIECAECGCLINWVAEERPAMEDFN